MKTLLSIFALLSISISVQASDWSFDYLDKLYKKDPKLCFKRSETIMNLFPKEESPYFFAMKIRTDEVYTAKTGKLRGTRMIKAIDYAKYFGEHASKELKERVHWDTIQTFLFELAGDVRENLEAEHLPSNVRQLDEKWKKFAGTSLDPEKYHDVAEVVTEKKTPGVVLSEESDAKTTNYTVSSFNGMPKGTENVASYSVANEKELLVMINKERKRQKMDTLIWNSDLSRACRYHAMDMGTQGYFEHNSFDVVSGRPKEIGETFDRIRTFYNASFVNSENIAAGNESATGTYNQWYNSKGHYENMFNASSKYVGIGVVKVPNSEYEYYWVFCTAEE